jgi:hypothetical protein
MTLEILETNILLQAGKAYLFRAIKIRLQGMIIKGME